jgi:hypothetical protein
MDAVDRNSGEGVTPKRPPQRRNKNSLPLPLTDTPFDLECPFCFQTGIGFHLHDEKDAPIRVSDPIRALNLCPRCGAPGPHLHYDAEVRKRLEGKS